MNKFLAEALAKLNAVFAVGLIILFSFVGLGVFASEGISGTFGFLVGAVVGVVVATVVCGTVSTISDMREILMEIRDQTSKTDSPPSTPKESR